MSAELHPEALPYSDYAGARSPDRRRTIDSSGVAISVAEWGDDTAPVLLLAHGGSDFARTHDLLAPRLAQGGWRVVSWDQRGHGDSDHAALYSWDADVRDAIAVLESTAAGKIALVGHSKGGGLLTELAHLLPERFSRFVNLDGLPSSRRSSKSDRPESERVRLRQEWMEDWLDRQRKIHEARRRPGTIEELAQRRQRMNPRLPLEWLQYLVTAGARRDEDGWRWKLDPALRFGRFGPWRPDWGLKRLRELRVPMLALLSSAAEPMSWNSTAAEVAPFLPTDAIVEILEGRGHFLHIEDPDGIAARVLEFLA